VGADAGGAPQVQVFDGKTGALLSNFFAFNAPTFKGGVRVAAGDTNGDGKAEVICAAGTGGGPQITIHDASARRKLSNFFAMTPVFTGGLFVAAGDLNGDGKADIIAGAGPGGGPQVSLFNGGSLALINNFFAFTPTFTGGVRVGYADANRNDHGQILTA